MKKLLFVLSLLLGSDLYAQDQLPIDASTGRFELTDVVDSKLTKDVLFKNAQNWIAKNFNDYKQTVQLEDKETGKIIMTGKDAYRWFTGSGVEFHDYVYTLTIDCKDNKYRYKIEDVRVPQGSSGALPIEKYNDFAKEVYVKHKDAQAKFDALPERKKSGFKGDLASIDIKYSKAEVMSYKDLFESIQTKFPQLIESLKRGMAASDEF